MLTMPSVSIALRVVFGANESTAPTANKLPVALNSPL